MKARASGAQAATADSQHAYCLALLARAVRSGRLSAASIDACAKATGVSRQMLQNFATLTSPWEPERIAEMLNMTDRCGRPISKIVLLKVARGPGSLRREFDEQIAKGELDLATLLRGLGPGALDQVKRAYFDSPKGRPALDPEVEAHPQRERHGTLVLLALCVPESPVPRITLPAKDPGTSDRERCGHAHWAGGEVPRKPTLTGGA